MALEFGELFLLVLIFFFVALCYASVGFGGGSSYLALLTLFIGSFFVIRSIALLCNMMVVSGSCFLLYKNGHFTLKKFLPFIISSVPMAFIGGLFKLTETIFFGLLGITLMISAITLLIQSLKLSSKITPRQYPEYLPYLLGSSIGLLSGMVGIGGGIFLAPILNHLKWDKPITIAALASFFILVNSVSGLSGLIVSGTFQLFWPEILFLLAAVLIGGQIGVRLSMSKLKGKGIRILTAILVLLVGIRVLIINGLQIHLFS